MTIDAAWRKVTALVKVGTADAATKAAHALGEATWKGAGQPGGVLNGEAATYLRNHWNRSSGKNSAPALKKALLAKLNAQPGATTAVAAGAAVTTATQATGDGRDDV